MHKHSLRGNHEKFQRWPMKSGFSSYFASIQPVPAYIGLISCLVIVFLFNSAEIWNNNQMSVKGLNIYLGPAISLLLFLILKIIRWRWRGSGGWVKLGDWNRLHGTLDKLDELVIRRNATSRDAPASPVSFRPSLDAGTEQPFFPAFSGTYPGQDYPSSQRRMSIPLSEIGPGDNEPIGDQRGISPVPSDTRTTPFNPQAAYFPPQAMQQASQTTYETPQSAYFTPPQFPPTRQQFPYQPYQPVDASPPSQNQPNQHDQYGQSSQNNQIGQHGQYGFY